VVVLTARARGHVGRGLRHRLELRPPSHHRILQRLQPARRALQGGLGVRAALEATPGQIDGFLSQLATRIGWHLWEVDLRFAPGLPTGWGWVGRCPPGWFCNKVGRNTVTSGGPVTVTVTEPIPCYRGEGKARATPLPSRQESVRAWTPASRAGARLAGWGKLCGPALQPASPHWSLPASTTARASASRYRS